MYFVFFFRNVIEHFYIKFNKTSIIFKRDFNDLSYFEKIFLTFFHRKNLFKDTIGNIYLLDDTSLVNFRKNNFPLIFFFHLYFDRSDYTISNLKFLKKFFFFLKNSKTFSKTLNFLKKSFFNKNYYINNFIVYLILQKILYKRYYNLCSSLYFNNFSENNLVKLNLLFFIFINNTQGLLHVYDLSKYNDWYNYNFNKNKTHKIKYKLKKVNSKLYSNFNLNRKNYIIKVYKKYNSFLKIFIKNFKSIYTFTYKNNVLNFIKIKINTDWVKTLKSYYPTRFNETSLSKHINLNNAGVYSFFFIRKNRIFNKGRYSRNRQLYRTGVYWCLWLNIMLVYGLYFMFYRFTFNFGYFWWGLLILAYSSIFSRIVKYNFFNIFYVKNEFLMFFKWFGLILINFRNLLINLLNYYIQKNYILIHLLPNNNLFLNKISLYLIDSTLFLKNLLVFKNYGKFVYFWENLNQKDESFLRYKSVLHWFNQFYKLMTY